MASGLPTLVTRLADRIALARLLGAALRHEVAPVALSEAPPPGQCTLDLRLGGSSLVSLLAEPAGTPQNGHFPLRLRPLDHAKAAKLYAILQAEGPPSSQSNTPRAIDSGPANEDSGPIARAMSGSAPPPALELDLAFDGPAEAPPARAARLIDDPRRTVRSAHWTLAISQELDDPGSWDDIPELIPANLPDDPRRTARSASWTTARLEARYGRSRPSVPVAVEADVDDPSLAGSILDVPDAARADEASLSVSVSFEPDPPAGGVAEGTVESFFDDALANLPMVPVGEGDDGAAIESEPPPTQNSVPVFTPRTVPPEPYPELPFSDNDDEEFDTLIHRPVGRSQAPPALPLPAAGMPADADARTRPPTIPPRRSKPPPPDLEPAGDPLVGRRIAEGKYSIESAIGSGATGAVYKATHRELRRTVAVKVLHPHYQQDPHFMKSFRAEALAASQLDHPNVMRVLDFGQEPDGLVYIVMEFLSGHTLQNLLDEERRLPTERAVEIMIQVCAALSVAHDNGIIHRDIKPDNIMLVPSRNDEGSVFELVKVCDFGIAALTNVSRDDAELGGQHDIAGTPEYMSPEQAGGVDIDARSDVYAAGICLYELVTGRPPFLGDNPAEILVKQYEEQPRPPSQLIRGLDPIVEEIILRAIQKAPSKRQQSARELRVELKEIIDPADAGGAGDGGERSIVVNVPVLDDPASGFPGFFIALSSAVLRVGQFERGHPEAAQAMKELLKATKAALRGRRELTFARRDSTKAVGFCVMTGYGEIVDLRRLLGSQLFGSFGYPFIEAVGKKGIAAITLREGIPDPEMNQAIELLLGPLANEELRNKLLASSLRSVSMLFGADVVGLDRKLSWKVGLGVARLARDLRALSNARGISLKKMREIREQLVSSTAQLLTKGEEVRQFLLNGDLVDSAVSHLRGFSGFAVAPLSLQRLLHEPSVEAITLLVADFDRNDGNRDLVKTYLRALALRLLDERSPSSDAAVAEVYRRSIVTDADVPRDLQEQLRAQSLGDALVREPGHFLRTLDVILDPEDYARELATLEAAMAVLARRGEASALLAAVSLLARHAKGSGKAGPRESHALRTMKSMIDKQRLVPIATALFNGPHHQREPARQLLVLAGSAGAHALYAAREALTIDPRARPLFVQAFRDTGPAGWSLLAAVLPNLEVNTDADVALVEDLLRAMPARQDAGLGDLVAKFLTHPRLRSAALVAIVALWGPRARKPLMDALEFADEPLRMLAIAELRRMRGIDDHAVTIIERLLAMKGSASEELRAAVAASLADVAPPLQARAVALLTKGVEGKRGFVAMLRGDGGNDETPLVTEAMARALLALDRAEGFRAVKARLTRADSALRSRLLALLQEAAR